MQKRSFWTFFLLNILTCGIYGLFFFYYWNEDVNYICDGDGEEVPNFIIVMLLSMVTCTIYWYYWLYKQGNRLQKTAFRYGIMMQENGTSFLLWGLLIPYVGYYLMIKALNELVDAWNYDNRNSSADFYQQTTNNQGNWQETQQNYPYMGCITCLDGPEPQRMTQIADAQTLILGQDSRVCNHIIMGFGIEAKHCSITYRKWDNMYLVTDYSVGGTYRANDDMRLQTGQMIELPSGSVIYLGDRRTLYKLG